MVFKPQLFTEKGGLMYMLLIGLVIGIIIGKEITIRKHLEELNDLCTKYNIDI